MKRVLALVLLVAMMASLFAGCATADKPVWLKAGDGHFRVTLGGAEIEMTGKQIEYRSGILADGEAAAAWKWQPVQGYENPGKAPAEPVEAGTETPPAPEAPTPPIPPAE